MKGDEGGTREEADARWEHRPLGDYKGEPPDKGEDARTCLHRAG